MKKLICFFILLIFVNIGCAPKFVVLNPHLVMKNLPPVNNVCMVELGDTVICKGKIWKYDGIVLKDSVTRGDGFFIPKVTIPAGKLLAQKEDKKRIFYCSSDSTVFLFGSGTYKGVSGICISKLDNMDRRIFWERPSFNSVPVTVAIEPTTVNAFESDSFQQELIYNGRNGNNVKFLYRELSNNMMRQPFSQEIQYDLNDGNTVGFKGARIEIIEANNTSLKYKLVQSFPDEEETE